MRKLPPSNVNKSQLGFSMIEILVTLVIVATALLGTAGLQIYAMRVGQSGQFRTQAVFLASDIAERMEANKTAALNGNYVIANTSAVPTLSTACSSGTCSATNLATYDLNQWSNTIATLLPQPSWQIDLNGNIYTIIVRWTDRSSDKSRPGETFSYSYTATRTISN